MAVTWTSEAQWEYLLMYGGILYKKQHNFKTIKIYIFVKLEISTQTFNL